ncbi:endoribonuclease YbeY [Sporosarcina sp. NCCP-2716]|uniref:rRNA maturation RNase YbeY n=1 Tax=Sporosarcina sp. NCCP-2716 TaxID=2943679 RepID=UPI00203C29E4|nr:rRNA maturation RNase YbeY [Sporosarcina sp. NCCP-2716]GKV68048.1 endoribonuclease YbeY [Sporosarcina sp. NCCP-2716]
MLVIDFIDETEGKGASAAPLIEELLTFAAEAEQLEDGTEVSVTFLDDAAIRHINREYRGKDQATDVISFALEEEGEGETAIRGTAGIPRHLGDLLISVETAERQAADYGHSVDREIGFLALHGFLHLLGYDHMTETDEKEMFGRQDEILAAYGLNR